MIYKPTPEERIRFYQEDIDHWERYQTGLEMKQLARDVIIDDFIDQLKQAIIWLQSKKINHE